MSLSLIKKDLLESDCKFIAHACNCVSKGSAGLAKAIFEKYPYADTYKSRALSSIPGTIFLTGNGEDKRYVINMYCQVFPGKFGKLNDLEEDRLKYFKECLHKILVFGDGDIAFPFMIGCGLAGGDWNNYYPLIKDFSDKYNYDVFVYKK